MSLLAGISLPSKFQQLLSLMLMGQDAENLSQVLDPVSLEKIRQEGLGPWLYHWIKLGGYEGCLPADLLKLLQQDYSQHLLGSALQQKEIQEILSALAKAGIEVILLKGADLRQRVYHDPVLRTMSDLDLLTAPASMPLAERVLTGMGYRLFSGHLDHRLRINEILLNPPPGKILGVDLHWEIRAIGYFYQLPYVPLRAESVSLDFYGIPTLTLSPEHLLVHVCLHAYENFPTLSQLLDLILIISSLPINWPKVVENTRFLDCQPPVYLMLREISAVFPAAIPADILTELRPSRISWLEQLVLKPQLRYLSLGLPFFYRHRNLRQWFQFMRANLWPNLEAIEASNIRAARQFHLQNLVEKFLSKFKSDRDV